MKRILIGLLAGVAAPAAAQHTGHSTPAAEAPQPSCTPEHAAMGHCTMPAPAPQPSCTPEHAAMGHCTMPAPAQSADPHPAQETPPEVQHPTADPHAAHEMPAGPEATADPHSGHQMSSTPQPPQAPPPPAAFVGPEHAADLIYDPQRMADAREELRREHGDLSAYRLFIERAESRIRDSRNGYLLDAQAWYGGDIDKAWLKSEVEGNWGEKPEHAEIQALWSHAIDPWFDLQTGVRYDLQPGPDRVHLVLGMLGLAPYWWEVDGALFLSNEGEITARGEAEYDLRITQQLILQPRGEIDLSLQDIPELGVGAGLSEVAVGARLRYQVSPLVAPYVGVEYERAFGGTADFRRAEGEKAGSWNLLAGIRMWF